MASRNSKSQDHSERQKLSVAEKFCNLKKNFACPNAPPRQVFPCPPAHIPNVVYEEKDVLFTPEEPESSP